MMDSNWTQTERALLDAILDQLIPANQTCGIQAAGELGVAVYLEAAAAQSASTKEALSTLLRQAATKGNVTTALVRELENDYPDAFQLLVIETYKGYYSRSDTRAMLGIAAHPIHPLGYDVAPESPALLDQLTAPVRERGVCYRDTTRAGDK